MKNGNSSSSYCEMPLFGAEDFRARTCQWLVPALVWLESEAGYGLASEGLLASFDRLLLSSRMSPACYPLPKDGTLPSSFQGWKSSGMAWRGALLTLNTSVWPKDASVCSLSEVLETSVARKYFLSPKAAAGILRRAEKRGKELPPQLKAALEGVARTISQPAEDSKKLPERSERRAGDSSRETSTEAELLSPAPPEHSTPESQQAAGSAPTLK